MSVVGRLWHRAPAWRLCVAIAIASTALAAMFPPALPSGLPGLARWGTHAPATPGSDPPPHYTPGPGGAPADYTTLASPPLGAGRSGVVPFAGRSLPLPAGSWQELVLGRAAGGMETQVALLDRADGNQLTGLMLVVAPGPMSGTAGPVGLPGLCLSPDAVVRQVTPASPDQNPMIHECWTLTASDITGPAAPRNQDEVVKRGLERLGSLAVMVPDHMLVLRYLRSDTTGWLLVTLFLPDERYTSRTMMRRMQDWARQFALLLHKGFDGTITAAEFTTATLRDPVASDH